MQYRTGTATLTVGSSTVTGSGTAWLANVQAGDLFWVSGARTVYHVSNVTSDTGLTLSAGFENGSTAGTVVSGANYVVSRSFTPNMSYPYPEPGDVDAVLVVARAIQDIDGDITSGGGGGGSTTLAGLSDVSTAGVVNGYVLTRTTGTPPYTFQPVPTGLVDGISNAGTIGAAVLRGLENRKVTARRLRAGSARITLTENTDDITLDVPNIGEANTASNVGTGTDVFKQKSGTNFEFRRLLPGANVSITTSGDDIVIGATASGGGSSGTIIGGQNAGTTGSGWVIGNNATNEYIRFKNWAVTAPLAATDVNNTITFGLGTFNLSQLSDATITSPSTGQIIQRSSTGRWVNANLPASGIASVSADANPSLGGHLQVGGFDIKGLVSAWNGGMERPKAKTYVLCLAVPNAITITSFTSRTGTGSLTVALRINGTSIGNMSAMTADTTLRTASASGSNTASANAVIELVLSNVSADASDFYWTISYRRA